jgi:membrane protein implicated in regulation of membrane protease activity
VSPHGPAARLGALAGRYRGFQPDARRFLVVTLVGGAATSLWWIDFNLYLAGYTVNFVTIIVLYTVATWLYWRWFGDAEPAGAVTELRPAAPVTTD